MVSVIGTAPTLATRDRRDLRTSDRLLTDSLAQGLVRFDAAGQIESGIAERWIVIDDGRSYIFRLRRAQWDDGSQVRAGDIVPLLRRQVSRGAANAVAPYLTAVASIVEMTPEVIEIELARPRPDLLKLFAQPEMALVRPGKPGGAGPFRRRAGARDGILLTPARDPDRAPDEEGPTPEQDVRLRGERAAAAILRFVERQSDLVSGGTLVDWPILRTANPAPANVRIDPAAGLFGLAIVKREGFLAAAANRAAVAQAFDRTDLTGSVSADWPARETVLPEQLDSAAPPMVPAWATLPPEQRPAAARTQVAAWRVAHGVPVLRLALPGGPGGTLLWARLARDLYAVGIQPLRVALDDQGADLRLLDRVAPYDSARWYLAEACVACSSEAAAAIEATRLADTLPQRAQAAAQADRLLTEDVAFVPLARPFRWSLVALRLRQWQPNPRAWHPLNRLRPDPN
ncbi:peptide/nickel transport system substrate-binding protein [Sphingomonas sp. BE138]|uniref:ABC transporter substrate-binding protein n=1 Tax=Sphingomonas sp. BE138 TaxID=2817845 RepID=UPI002865D436|nr:ABC transporter substrate-binding protein [Sphingomonas sp. BE138]MDR6790392.1 peptide/nickel transport system substrate-binding protein [Sphingomonas sp. BE138]